MPKTPARPAAELADELDPVVADHLSEILDEADENAAEDVTSPTVTLTAAQARVVRWMVTALSGLGYAEVLDDAGDGEVVDLAALSTAITGQLGDGR